MVNSSGDLPDGEGVELNGPEVDELHKPNDQSHESETESDDRDHRGHHKPITEHHCDHFDDTVDDTDPESLDLDTTLSEE